MARKAILTVTLPYNTYCELDRDVEYEIDTAISQQYDEQSINDVLYVAIESDYGKWERMLKAAYKDALQREYIRIKYVWEQAFDILEDLEVDDVELELQRRSCRLIMTFEEDIEEIDDRKIQGLLHMLASEVVRPQCTESVEFDPRIDEIPELVVHLSISYNDYIDINKLQHTVEYE